MTRIPRLLVISSALAATVGSACTDGAPSIMDPKGPAAQRIAGLWWLMLALSAVVFVFVCAMLLVALVRARVRTEDDARRPVGWGEPFIVIGGIVVTALVLVAVFLVSIRDLRAIADDGKAAALEIEIVGHDWWWEARYPRGAVTANEIHIPVGRTVRLRLRTDDVIHSFWVPQLGPKTDMVPGRTNTMLLEASEPGRYRGQCAEFCGFQHAKMLVWVVADEPDEFERWLDNEAETAGEPTGASARRGERIFMRSTCADCHAVRGTDAAGTLGPDLTHLAARRTIGSGVLPMTTGHLASWITDPQDSKPGSTMPASAQLSDEEISALVAYLEGLR